MVQTGLYEQRRVFSSGHAPRSIQFCQTSDSLFVGCKDGTIRVISQLTGAPEDWSSTILSRGETPVAGVRSMADIGRGWLLVGQDGGALHLVNWRDPSAPWVEYRNPELDVDEHSPGRVSHVGLLDDDVVLVSHRRHGTWVGKIVWSDDPSPAPSIEYDHKVELEGGIGRSGGKATNARRVCSVICAVLMPQDRGKDAHSSRPWLMVTESGLVYKLYRSRHRYRAKFQVDLDEKYECGFVSDFAAIKHNWVAQSNTPIFKRERRGVYLATANGLLLVSYLHPKQAHRILLPGVTEMTMAVSFFADTGQAKTSRRRRSPEPVSILDQGKKFLWVSDAGGDAYLFEAAHEDHESLLTHKPSMLFGAASPWRACGVRYQGNQIVRAFLSWVRPTTDESLAPGDRSQPPLLIGQASRDDKVIISLFSEGRPDRQRKFRPRPGHGEILRLLTSGGVSDLQAIATQMQSSRERPTRWRPSTMLADIFEWASESNPDELIDFLRRPNTALALEVLSKETKTVPSEEVHSQVPLATNIIMLWTHTLLGALHQIPLDPDKKPFLGIVRWLRMIQQDSDKESWSHWASFHDGIEEAIRDARKWGTYGKTYRQSKGLDALIRHLEQPDGRIPFRRYRRRDSLAYGTRLLAQRYDLEAQACRPRVHPDGPPETLPEVPNYTAWDLKIDTHPDSAGSSAEQGWKRFAVVSWSHGLEVYEVGTTSQPDETLGLPPGSDLGASIHTRSQWSMTRVWPNKDREVSANPGSYARAVAIARSAKDHETPLLIWSFHTQPRTEKENADARGDGESEGESREERLSICALTSNPKGQFRRRPGDLLNPALPDGEDRCSLGAESVYSLLYLEPGLVLVGLRGREGRPRLGLLDIPTAADARFHELELSLDPALPPGEQVDKNPIRALAASHSCDDCPHQIAVGCNDGAVWSLTIPRRRELLKMGWGHVNDQDPQRVGVLGSAVWSVAIRAMPTSDAYWESRDRDLPDEMVRIVAGGGDGSLVAWQYRDRSWYEGVSLTRWVPLWATRESGPVSRIHLFDRTPENLTRPPEGVVRDRSTWGLLAVTHEGRGIVFLDRPEVEIPTPGKTDRLWIPGQRLDRIDFGAPLFASDIIRGGPSDCQWSRLLFASNDGQLRLVQPRYLHSTYARQGKFRELLDTWAEEMNPEHGGLYYLRLQEAMALASDHLPLTPIRWCLDQRTDLPDRSFFPRRTRLVVDLAHAWNEARDAPESERRERADEVGSRFRRILYRSRKYGHSSLYREVIEAVLQRMNGELVMDDNRGAIQIANVIMAVLQRDEDIWLGAPDNLDEHLRIVCTKALLDGPVLRRLALASEGSAPLARVLRARVQLVEKLIERGDPLLTLETLRAVNLSLIRFVRHIPETSEPRPSLPWSATSSFFQRLKSVAGRFANSGPGLDDALRHEVCRAFALAICCCPDHTFLICRLLSEANLSVQVFQLVAMQVRALEELGVSPPPNTVELFDLATAWREPQRRGLNLLRPAEVRKWVQISDETRLPDERLAPEAIERILRSDSPGERNEEFAQAWLPWYWILEELETVAKTLEQQPSRLSVSWLKSVQELLLKLEVEPTHRAQDHYSHSRAFWTDHLVLCAERRKREDWLSIAWSIADELGFDDSDDPEAMSEHILLHPRLLTEFQPTLLRWCDVVAEDIKDRRSSYRLFEPEATVYANVINRLSRVAENLPISAAILSNVVVGILSHGLLESVIENGYMFEEVARTIDPVQESSTWLEGGPRDELVGTAHMFAAHIHQLREKAADVPRALLTLKELLTNPDAGDENRTLESLFDQHAALHRLPATWLHGGWELYITEREARFLLLVLSELHDNDRKHGNRASSPSGARRLPTATAQSLACNVDSRPYPASSLGQRNKPGTRLDIRLSFSFGALTANGRETDDYTRLVEIQRQHLNFPVTPSRESKGLSHGTGLYMARIGAAMVDWTLMIEKITNTDPGDLIYRLVGPCKELRNA